MADPDLQHCKLPNESVSIADIMAPGLLMVTRENIARKAMK